MQKSLHLETVQYSRYPLAAAPTVGSKLYEKIFPVTSFGK